MKGDAGTARMGEQRTTGISRKAFDERLRLRWLEMQPTTCAFYINFAVASLLLLLLAEAGRPTLALTFCLTAVAASALYWAAGFLLRLRGQGAPPDRVIFAIESIAAVGWAAACSGAAFYAANWAEASRAADAVVAYRPTEPETTLAMLIAIWGGALAAGGMFNPARPMIILLTRIVSTAVMILFVMLSPFPFNAVFLFVVALLIAMGMAAGVAYLSYLRAAKETALQLLLEEARDREEQEYARRQTIVRSVGHDLRQPITALRLLSRPLKSRLGDRDELGLSIESAISAAHDLLDSIEQMAWLSDGRERARPAEAPLGSLLEMVAAESAGLAAQRGVTVRVAPTSVALWTDPLMLRRILRNLVDNALKHGDGDVLIGVRHRSSDAAPVEIWVVDRGPGVPADEVERLFGEFSRGRQTLVDGLGVGLAVVKDLSEALGCDPVIRSTLGRGSVFGVIVPVSAVLRRRGGPARTARSHTKSPLERAQIG